MSQGKKKINHLELTIGVLLALIISGAVFLYIYLNAHSIIKERDMRIPSFEVAITPAIISTDIKIDEQEEFESTSLEKIENEAFIKSNDMAFIQDTELGKLPKRDSNNLAPWKYYAQNFAAKEKSNRVVVILNNVGFDQDFSRRIFQVLPKTTTLAFNPYGQSVNSLASIAKENGYEFLMMLPMEAKNSSKQDAGTKALLTSANDETNLENLFWSMSKETGYVGLINHLGDSFIRPNNVLDLVFFELKQRGLIFINSLGLETNLGEDQAKEYDIPYLSIDLTIDKIKTEQAIARQLKSLEMLSKEFGYAIGMINNTPLSIHTFIEWEKTLKDKNIELVPITNLFLQPI